MTTLIEYYLTNSYKEIPKGSFEKKQLKQNKRITNYMTKWQLAYKSRMYK